MLNGITEENKQQFTCIIALRSLSALLPIIVFLVAIKLLFSKGSKEIKQHIRCRMDREVPQYTNWNSKYTYCNSNGNNFNSVRHIAVGLFSVRYISLHQIFIFLFTFIQHNKTWTVNPYLQVHISTVLKMVHCLEDSVLY